MRFSLSLRYFLGFPAAPADIHELTAVVRGRSEVDFAIIFWRSIRFLGGRLGHCTSTVRIGAFALSGLMSRAISATMRRAWSAVVFFQIAGVTLRVGKLTVMGCASRAVARCRVYAQRLQCYLSRLHPLPSL